MKKSGWMLALVLLGGTLISACGADEDNYSGERAAVKEPMESAQEAPFDKMYFQDYGTNSFVSADEAPLSTFAVDVDTGSYAIARSYIERGQWPPQEAIRVEEFVNAIDPGYKPPQNDTFAIHVEAGPSPWEGEEELLVRIGIKGKEISEEDRRAANLVFVIDVSDSMDRDNRIDLVKESLRLLLGQLREEDRIGIVVYGTTARELIGMTSAEERELLMDAIGGIEIEGATNMEEGLLLGYRMAEEAFEPNRINRVILCSDGVANVGETRHDGILERIGGYSEREIYLSTFGFGMGNYNDVMMEQLADRGNGVYAYIDDKKEAIKVFRDNLTGTLQTIARDAKIQVEFDPGQIDSYRLLGYENRALSDADFRNNRADGGEVGSGHSVTALYQVRLVEPGADAGDIGHVTIRYRAEEDHREVREMVQSIRLAGELSGSARFQAAVAEFAITMRTGEAREGTELQAIRKLASKNARTKEQKDFVELMDRAIELERGRD
ncbi:vWA domain-containing protein [Cohnella boryungensis]|uniref:von Willebrand factor type A domain-containing protein n=1 Tax=Cohnella boryungensis TaxID=768479 RepID=A0ABV8SD30_9BACL